MAFPLFLVLYRRQMTFLGLNGKIMEKAFLNEGLSQAKLCVGGCKALRWQLQSFASEMGKNWVICLTHANIQINGGTDSLYMVLIVCR